MSRGAWRYAALANNTAEVKAFCEKYQFRMMPFNNGYQLRIEGILDVYPVRQRWHSLLDGDRGSWTTMDDLRRVLLDKIPVTKESTATYTFVPQSQMPPGPKRWWQFWRKR